MNLKAFNKILDEAEEAVAERRLSDVLALTEAILKDTTCPDTVAEVNMLRQRYTDLLQALPTISHGQMAAQSQVLIRCAIDTLQTARDSWKHNHPETSLYATFAAKTSFVRESDVISQLQHLATMHVGQTDYHTTLDATFTMLWCQHIGSATSSPIAQSLIATDSFARRTLISALLLSILDYFNVAKIQLLLAIANPQKDDSEEDSIDLMARAAIALTIIYQRYETFLHYYPDEQQQMRAFFENPYIRKEMPTLLTAYTAQSATYLADQSMDSIEALLKDLFEKKQPRLGNDEPAKETKKETQQPEIQFATISIDNIDDQELFNKLSSHARKIDELRMMHIDVNQQSFIHMKHFSFFAMPAHWFYPFSPEVPAIKDALTRKNGKIDRLTLSIMEHNRFCASDRYTYASMMDVVRRKHSKGFGKFSDMLNDQLEEMQDEIDEMDFDDDFDDNAKQYRLHPFFDYCQSLQRFMYATNVNFSYAFRPFDLKRLRPLPLLPLFDGLFDGYKSLSNAIDLLMHVGGFEEVIVLVDYSAEHFGIDAQTLHARGHALMRLQKWERALSAFQQQLLFEENTEAQLSMARCYEAIGSWDKALPLLIDEEQRQTAIDEHEAVNIIEETGRCLIEMQRWDDAVQRFFRLELMEKHLNVARRAIAWCSIKQGKYERAAAYYLKLIDQRRANWEDRLNYGHALLLQGRLAEALKAYKQSQTNFNRTKKEQRQHFRHWSEAFMEDSHTILADHFDPADCALIIDAVALQ